METDLKETELPQYALEETTPATKIPEKPPELTAKQLGQLRRRWVTKVNGTVRACGHKDNFSKTDMRAGKQPNSNCVECWKAYFMTSVDLEGIHVVLTKQGVRALVALRGKKFTKMFHGFLSACLLPALAAEATQQLPTGEPAKIDGGIFANGHEGTEVQDPILAE
jgi:hypothetical protein